MSLAHQKDCQVPPLLAAFRSARRTRRCNSGRALAARSAKPAKDATSTWTSDHVPLVGSRNVRTDPAGEMNFGNMAVAMSLHLNPRAARNAIAQLVLSASATDCRLYPQPPGVATSKIARVARFKPDRTFGSLAQGERHHPTHAVVHPSLVTSLMQ